MSSSTVSERPSLTTHVRRFGQDWGPPSANTSITPFSAVSSFNLPAQYDASLITPVSTTRSPSVLGKYARVPSKDQRESKLSPTISSPDYLAYSGDEEFKSPMKLKTPSSALQIKTSSPFPSSPLVCRSPYWGAFGVSATCASTKSRSPGPNESPNTSAGAFSADGRPSRQHTPLQSISNYRPQNPAPILTAPNPSTLRGGSRSSADTSYRHDSVTSMASTPSSQATNPRDYEMDGALEPLPMRRKRKTPPRPEEVDLSTEISHEDQILIQLSEKESLQWKDVAQRFNELTGKNMKVPALQMRKKRLRERLRVWTDVDQPKVHHIDA